MKKVLSVLLVAVMLVAFAVPAMADQGPSEKVDYNVEVLEDPQGTGEVAGDNPDNLTVEVHPYAGGAQDDDEHDAIKAAQAAVEASGVDEAEVDSVDIFDVGVYKEGTKQPGANVTVSVAVEKNGDGEVLGVMYYHGGAWHKATGVFVGADGKIHFTMAGLCSVVVLYGKTTAPSNPGGNKKPSSTGSTSPKSPKTGY